MFPEKDYLAEDETHEPCPLQIARAITRKYGLAHAAVIIARRIRCGPNDADTTPTTDYQTALALVEDADERRRAPIRTFTPSLANPEYCQRCYWHATRHHDADCPPPGFTLPTAVDQRGQPIPYVVIAADKPETGQWVLPGF